MTVYAEDIPLSALLDQHTPFRMEQNEDQSTTTQNENMDCTKLDDAESTIRMIEMKTHNPIIATSPSFVLTTKRIRKAHAFVLIDEKLRKNFIPHDIVEYVLKALWSVEQQKFLLLTEDCFWSFDPNSKAITREGSIEVDKNQLLSSFAIIQDQLVIATDRWGSNTLSHWKYHSEDKQWHPVTTTAIDLPNDQCLCDITKIGNNGMMAALIFNQRDDHYHVQFIIDTLRQSVNLPKDQLFGDVKIMGSNDEASDTQCLIWSSEGDHVIVIGKSQPIQVWQTDMNIEQMTLYKDCSILVRSKKMIILVPVKI